jgi:hypothetical protein
METPPALKLFTIDQFNTKKIKRTNPLVGGILVRQSACLLIMYKGFISSEENFL